jgi:hypothetical protein
VLREHDRRVGFLERLLQHPAAADELDRAQILGVEREQVEGIEARPRLTSGESVRLKSGRPCGLCATAWSGERINIRRASTAAARGRVAAWAPRASAQRHSGVGSLPEQPDTTKRV